MTLDFKIHKNIGAPTPRPRLTWGKWRELPLDSLEIGDVIEISLTPEQILSSINAVRSYVSRTGTKERRDFSVTTTDEGICVWRKG